MLVSVDSEECMKTGGCAQTCPEVFNLGSDGLLHVVINEPPAEYHDRVREAADYCPTGAIMLQ